MKRDIANWLEKNKDGKVLLFLDELICRMSKHRVDASSAQLAYFLLLSLFPFLMVLLNVISRLTIVNPDAVDEIVRLFPAEAAKVIYAVIADLQLGYGSTLQLILSIVGSIYFASLGLKPMIYACNLAFISNKKRSGIIITILGIIFTIAFTAFVVLFFATNVIGDQIARAVFRFLDIEEVGFKVWYFLKNLVTPVYMVIMLYLLNKFSIPKEVRRNATRFSLWPGAIFSTVVMILASKLFTFQVSMSDRYALIYGSISGVIIMLVWLYLMGMILVMGFEINGIIYFRQRGIKGLRDGVFDSLIKSLRG